MLLRLVACFIGEDVKNSANSSIEGRGVRQKTGMSLVAAHHIISYDAKIVPKILHFVRNLGVVILRKTSKLQTLQRI